MLGLLWPSDLSGVLPKRKALGLSEAASPRAGLFSVGVLPPLRCPASEAFHLPNPAIARTNVMSGVVVNGRRSSAKSLLIGSRGPSKLSTADKLPLIYIKEAGSDRSFHRRCKWAKWAPPPRWLTAKA